jgi:hypothetical protein
MTNHIGAVKVKTNSFFSQLDRSASVILISVYG